MPTKVSSLAVVSLLSATACKDRSYNAAETQDSVSASALALHPLESRLEGEEAAIAEAVRLAEEGVNKTRASHGKSGRDFHTKAYGCVKASFTVQDQFDSRLKLGIFATPKTYPAWIRFSSGENGNNPDTKSGVIGLAVKLMEVPGVKVLPSAAQEKTQDFLLVNAPILPLPNIHEYVAVQKNPLLYAATHWKFVALLRKMQGAKPSNPTEERYWSQAAFGMGSSAVKYSAIPCSQEKTPYPENPSATYLTEALQNQLNRKEVCFKFMAQSFVNQQITPVENPMVEWEEKDAPFVQVATLTIPAQEFRTPERTEFCENLSYTPWHSLPENRPLGNLNRARMAVYEATSKKRHAENNAPRVEPMAE